MADHDDRGRPRLTWQPPADPARWLGVLFPMLWLCGWVFGELSAFWELLQDLLAGFQLLSWFSRLFMIVWLVGWTAGGIMVARMVRAAVRGPGPERLTFGTSVLYFETGTAFAPSSTDEAASRTPKGSRPRSVHEIPRSQIQEIRLDREGARQRLTIRYGETCLEVGKELREPEREWLAAVLRAWAG